MSIEIERKFIPADDSWRQLAQRRIGITQGYLSSQPQRTVRIRRAGEQAWITVKGISSDASRREYEYSIPPADADFMLYNLCEQPLIEKWRYIVPHAGHIWEIDEFSGDNAGLIIAEIELRHSNEQFCPPPWLGKEVTGDCRYYNSSLIATPYCTWTPTMDTK